MAFSDQFDALLAKKLAYLTKVRNAGVFSVASRIIDDTPVLTGALKGSWKSTLVAPSTDDQERIDVAGEVPKAELKAAIEAWPEKGSLFMSNHQDYSEGVEFDGWSTQQPAGMVRKNILGLDFASLKAGSGRVE